MGKISKMIGCMVLSATMGIGAACGKADTAEAGKENPPAEQEKETAVETSAGANKEKNKEEQTPFQGYVVTISQENSWPDEERTAYQISAEFQNRTREPVEEWQFVLDPGIEVEVTDFWNCSVSQEETLVAFSSVDYNAEIAAGASVNDIGIIFSSEAPVNLEGMYMIDAENGMATKLSEEERLEVPDTLQKGTPLANHGALAVKGTDLVDKDGKAYQLKGISTHNLAWFPEYVNKEAFQTLRDDWGANLIRLAMYTDENGGYCTDGDPAEMERVMDRGVQAATDLGMYVIIDWHILHDLTPVKYQDQAEAFFEKMSAKYADYDNVLYEICNEPNGDTSWSEVKSYAEDIIPIIRKHAPESVIIVGTPTWSQDVDQAAADPIPSADNLMYTLHFYAATHKDDLRNKLTAARKNGLPIFVSEFSLCDASGNGGVDYDSAAAWKQLIEQYNLSYAGWNLSNKNEASAILIPGTTSSTGGWTDKDLSETGRWLKKLISGK